MVPVKLRNAAFYHSGETMQEPTMAVVWDEFTLKEKEFIANELGIDVGRLALMKLGWVDHWYGISLWDGKTQWHRSVAMRLEKLAKELKCPSYV